MSKKPEDIITVDENKQIKLYAKNHQFYFGDDKKGIVDTKVIESSLGTFFVVAELEEVTYEELLQRSFKNAYDRNPNYYEEDRITSFLNWCDDILFDIGNFEWSYNEKNEKFLYLSYFFFTKMTKYKNVLNEEIFERKSKIYVNKTTRPIIKKIVRYIKKND